MACGVVSESCSVATKKHLHLHEVCVSHGRYIFDRPIGALSSWKFDQFFVALSMGIVQTECTVSTSWRRGQIVRRHIFFLSLSLSLFRDSIGRSMNLRISWNRNEKIWRSENPVIEKAYNGSCDASIKRVHSVSDHAVNARKLISRWWRTTTAKTDGKKKNADEWICTRALMQTRIIEMEKSSKFNASSAHTSTHTNGRNQKIAMNFIESVPSLPAHRPGCHWASAYSKYETV